MHILEKYALDCGLNIYTPYIYEEFYPLDFDEKYIVISTSTKLNNNNYKYWNEVIEIVLPYLKNNNIKVLAFCPEESPIEGARNINDKISLNKKAYLIKRAILFVGQDEIETQIASSFNKKNLTIYSNYFEQNTKPYWSKKHLYIGLKPTSDAKPSIDKYDELDLVNKIYPEEIAKSILDLLNIEYNKMPKTLYIGKEYCNKTLEIVPSEIVNPQAINIEKVVLRMDYSFNEKSLAMFLKFKKCIIYTDRPIDLNILKFFKKNIICIIFNIKDSDIEFIKNLKFNAIRYHLISELSDEKINQIKLNYMDYGIIYKKHRQDIPKEIKDKNNLYFKSRKILISDKGIFYSKFHWENGINHTSEVPKDERFFEDLDKMYIYTLE